MMNQVIHHESAHDRSARQSKDRLATHEQRPLFLPTFIAGSFERSPCCRNIFVESCEQLSGGLFFFQTIFGSSRRRDIQFIAGKSFLRPTGNVGEMSCQTTESHRLFMWLPTELIVRHALESLASVCHFIFKLRQNHFRKRHYFFSWLVLSGVRAAEYRMGGTATSLDQHVSRFALPAFQNSDHRTRVCGTNCKDARL